MARSEEAVFQWVRRWWEAGARPEAELLAVLRHVRFAAMAGGFLCARRWVRGPRCNLWKGSAWS